MEHKEYIRVVPGSRRAVLMIHGIAGTPAHFRDLIPVIPENWSVYNIVLDGHGKTVRDFSRTSMKKWKAQVAAMLEELFARYEHIVLVGHSMGTLFSIEAAIAHPERIDKLFLLAVPTRPQYPPSTFATSLRVSQGNLAPEDTAALAMASATGITLSKNPFAYIGWLPRIVELLVLCRQVRKLLPRLTVPCRTYQSQVDELVSARSIKDLENHPYIHNTVLHNSGHFAYGPEDTRLLQKEFSEFLDSTP